MKLNYVWIACALLVMAGCTEEETDFSQDKPIHGYSSIGGRTRAGIIEDASGNTQAFDFYFVRQDVDNSNLTTGFVFDRQSEGSRANDGKVTFKADDTDFTDDYTKTNDYAYFRMFNKITIGSTENPVVNADATTLTWSGIDGKSDILASAAWNAGRYTNPVTTGIDFKHALARLQIKCRNDKNESIDAARDAWGQIKSITIKGMNSTMVYTWSTDAYTYSIPQDFLLFQEDCSTDFATIDIPEYGGTTDDTNTTIQAGIMLPPLKSANADSNKQIELKVVTTKDGSGNVADTSYDVAVITLDQAFDEGLIHTITLTFKVTAKTISATASSITKWNVGGTGAGSIEK